MWQQIINENHSGYGNDPDYKTILSENPITEKDLEYFSSIINKALHSKFTSDYDCFPDEGGIDIAAVLLEEVKRLRSICT